jgi:hypothetical protein
MMKMSAVLSLVMIIATTVIPAHIMRCYKNLKLNYQENVRMGSVKYAVIPVHK